MGVSTWGRSDLRPPPIIYPNAGSRNSIYRGKCLGTSVTTNQWNFIKNGTFDDLFVGDYWQISGKTYRIAGFDCLTHVEGSNVHHCVIVPDENFGESVMNSTVPVIDGYNGSTMNKTKLPSILSTITNAFGDSQVLSHNILVSSNFNTSGGVIGNHVWLKTKIALMTSIMVFGYPYPIYQSQNSIYVWQGNEQQLPMFRYNPDLLMIGWESYWLRDMIDANNFALVIPSSHPYYSTATTKNFIRPYFLIG